MNRPADAIRLVALTGRTADRQVGDAMAALAAHLQSRGVIVRTHDGLSAAGEEDFAQGADLVVAVGGDGTMLHAARTAARTAVPVLGVNRGRLGFLADVGPEHMIESLDDALAGRCVPERRTLLEASFEIEGKRHSALALNDVVVSKRDSGRMVDVQTWVDGIYVHTHGGDGFIVATSTGSTAYALSCGGPIVHPGLAALVLVPICPHTLSDRPLVVGAESVVELAIEGRSESRAHVVCDGIVLGELPDGVKLRVARSSLTATLLHPPGHDYYRILRSKLHWGRSGRNTPSAGE